MSGTQAVLSSLFAMMSLVSIAEAGTPSPLAGTFGGNAIVSTGYVGNVSQTLSPDNGALSIIFDGFKIDEQSGLKRRSSSYYAVTVPISPVSAGTVDVDLRGDIRVLGAGTTCAVTLHTDSGQVLLKAVRSKNVMLRKSIDVLPGDSEITIYIYFSCAGKTGKTAYLTHVDSLDLKWSRQNKNKR